MPKESVFDGIYSEGYCYKKAAPHNYNLIFVIQLLLVYLLYKKFNTHCHTQLLLS